MGNANSTGGGAIYNGTNNSSAPYHPHTSVSSAQPRISPTGQSSSTTPSPGYTTPSNKQGQMTNNIRGILTGHPGSSSHQQGPVSNSTNPAIPSYGAQSQANKSPGVWRSQKVMSGAGEKIYNGVDRSSLNGSRPPSAERTQPNGGSSGYGTHHSMGSELRNNQGADHQRMPSGSGVYSSFDQQQPPPLPSRNVARSNSSNNNEQQKTIYNGHNAQENGEQNQYGQYAMPKKMASAVAANERRDSSNSPLRHRRSNSIEMNPLRGSNQDISRVSGYPQATSASQHSNHVHSNKQNSQNHGYSSHGELAQTMSQLALNSHSSVTNGSKTGGTGNQNQNQRRLNLETDGGGYLNPNYSPSEASSQHSVTPPLPPLSPSNTPPLTPPGSPRGLPPHIRGSGGRGSHQQQQQFRPQHPHHPLEQPHPHHPNNPPTVYHQLTRTPDVITSTGNISTHQPIKPQLFLRWETLSIQIQSKARCWWATAFFGTVEKQKPLYICSAS